MHGPDNYKNVAFFPLFPLLIRTTHDAIAVVARAVTGWIPPDGTFPPYLWAGLLVANLCTAGALVFLYGLVRLDYGRAVARRTVTLLSLSPMSFFLFAAYSEGAFLLCAAGCFYMLRQQRWWQAGLWGLLAAATRPPGAVLVVPFLMTWAQVHPVVTRLLAARLRLTYRRLTAPLRLRLQGAEATAGAAVAPLALDLVRSGGASPHRRAGVARAAAGVPPTRPFSVLRLRAWPADVRQAARAAAPAVAIPLGLLLFMAFLFQVFGDPLLFSHAQVAWWRAFAPPWKTFVVSITWPFSDILHGTMYGQHLTALHDLVYELVGLPLTWLASRRLSRVYSVYLWLLWAVVLSSPAILMKDPNHDVLMSLPRMMLMMFPLFIYLGMQRRLYPWLSVGFAAGLAIYTAMFLTGGWVS